MPFNYINENVVMKETSYFICPLNNGYFLYTGSFLPRMLVCIKFDVVLVGVVTMGRVMA